MIPKPEFAPRLIRWQRIHGRHDLPWQGTRDPYHIWLAEIMLQQTQVASVMPYYRRFLARFPDLMTLTNAPFDAVMAHWSGLGYYARARHLQQCAQRIVEEYGGVFPRDVKTLMTLPGIGRSTAAAIAAFASGARHSILDGNVKRVLTRVFGVEGLPGAAQVDRALWTLAESLLPPPVNQAEDKEAMRAYTQGLMDLGALVCTRTRPSCAQCPFQHECIAYTTNRTHELPQTHPKKTKPVRRTLMLVLRSGDSVLLERRAPEGIWGGLWSLPEAADETMLQARAARFGVFGPFTPLATVTHTFTHFQLMIKPRLMTLPAGGHAASPVMGEEQAWVALRDMHQYGLPAPVRRLLKTCS